MVGDEANHTVVTYQQTHTKYFVKNVRDFLRHFKKDVVRIRQNCPNLLSIVGIEDGLEIKEDEHVDFPFAQVVDIRVVKTDTHVTHAKTWQKCTRKEHAVIGVAKNRIVVIRSQTKQKVVDRVQEQINIGHEFNHLCKPSVQSV